MLSAVPDSGPLIHLNEINQINLLNLFDILTVPTSVAEEVGELIFKNIKIANVSEKDKEFIKLIRKFKLQQAEIDALYLAYSKNSMLLTDDLEARDAARHIGVEVHGSLGIISMAYKKQTINLAEAKRFIFDLYHISTLFLTKSLVDLAIDKLEKS